MSLAGVIGQIFTWNGDKLTWMQCKYDKSIKKYIFWLEHAILWCTSKLSKVGCIFPMAILSEFRIGEYRDDQEDAPHFNFVPPRYKKCVYLLQAPIIYILLKHKIVQRKTIFLFWKFNQWSHFRTENGKNVKLFGFNKC